MKSFDPFYLPIEVARAPVPKLSGLEFRTSITRMNNMWERGSPCRSPLL
jgi:hypothetical protein